jgi:hypothetical protein
MTQIPLINKPVSADRIQDSLNGLIDQINQYFAGLSPEQVDITGGTIDGTVIGGTTPAAGTFTALNATSGEINGDTIATLLAAQTLVNKLLTAPVITGGTVDNAVIGGLIPAAITATSLQFSPSTGGIIGTVAADDAAAGEVGEYLSSTVPLTSSISIANGPVVAVTSLSLTPGDWDVGGLVGYNTNGTATDVNCIGFVSTTSALPTDGVSGGVFNCWPEAVASTQYINNTVSTTRFNLAATTTVSLYAQCNYTGTGMTTFGFMRARRVR